MRAQMRKPGTSFADKNNVQRLAADALQGMPHVTSYNLQVRRAHAPSCLSACTRRASSVLSACGRALSRCRRRVCCCLRHMRGLFTPHPLQQQAGNARKAVLGFVAKEAVDLLVIGMYRPGMRRRGLALRGNAGTIANRRARCHACMRLARCHACMHVALCVWHAPDNNCRVRAAACAGARAPAWWCR